ncbi:hypothetical protein [Mycobacterium sp. 1274756.6]|uniref:hypothetical protein n=1 Tax=Mycobacterium sp. 1274756.6 TaxID=1834076 RepID=UPI0008003D60|nr:hypothetical protein [Mycobacterium sp. 1274756.6]OBJ74374.1 hypothetical protein A5643_01575 [Mycobacterium sp. 1274756.6]
MMGLEVFRWRVECDHGPAGSCHVADIDDGRLIGRGVHVMPWATLGFAYSTAVDPLNKLGARTSYPFRCTGCSLNFTLQSTTVPLLLDRIEPIRSELPVETVEIHEPATADELFASVFNEPTQLSAVRYERRHVMQFDTLCKIVSKLRE